MSQLPPYIGVKKTTQQICYVLSVKYINCETYQRVNELL